jgi:hypothetical protein
MRICTCRVATDPFVKSLQELLPRANFVLHVATRMHMSIFVYRCDDVCVPLTCAGFHMECIAVEVPSSNTPVPWLMISYLV